MIDFPSGSPHSIWVFMNMLFLPALICLESQWQAAPSTQKYLGKAGYKGPRHSQWQICQQSRKDQPNPTNAAHFFSRNSRLPSLFILLQHQTSSSSSFRAPLWRQFHLLLSWVPTSWSWCIMTFHMQSNLSNVWRWFQILIPFSFTFRIWKTPPFLVSSPTNS